MSWVFLSLLSALFLGLYDLAKKQAVRDNAVFPVLFFSVLTGAVLWLPLVFGSALAPNPFTDSFLYVEPISGWTHLLLFLKSLLVGTSWTFSYFAVKHLPLSIAGPIRATAPIWVIFLAIAFMQERPNSWQWVGIAIVVAAFYAFTLVGKLEGIRFHRDKWVGFMLVATLLGACSALYDKFLLQQAALTPATVQAWFSIYLVVVLFPCYLLWLRGRWPRGTFQWRWSILLIGLALLIADFLYFTAITDEDALIAIISPIRRAAVIVSFIGGITLYDEKNFRPKAACVLALLAGIALIHGAS